MGSNKKFCPFRKETTVERGDYGQFSSENFLPCIEEACGIWDEDANACGLLALKDIANWAVNHT